MFYVSFFIGAAKDAQKSDNDGDSTPTDHWQKGRCEVRILVMNVFGEGHTPFNEAKDKYEALECVTFMTAEVDAVDLQGNQIKVGEGERVPSLMAGRKRVVSPTPKVRRWRCVGL